MEELINYLNSIEEESIKDTSKLGSLLQDCWEQFSGSEAEGMESYKLIGRIEDAFWNPPELTFNIERHGGTVLGSTRAEIHRWTLDISARTASCSRAGFRQINPRAPNLDVNSIAEEIFELIKEHKEDERLRRKSDGTVTIAIGKILPQENLSKPTIEGRRRHFRKKLTELYFQRS